jgi:A/G-specific adenine glycosylase
MKSQPFQQHLPQRIKRAQFHQILLDWWRKNGRVLPWRQKLNFSHEGRPLSADRVRDEAFVSYFAGEKGRDPYRVVVSEMMLQQTQVERVLSKYSEWMKKWPTIHDLAAAELPEVFVIWQGLGYNRRARFLWLLAQSIHEKGGWPESEAELMQLPGIGKYTARAVLSFAFGKHVGVVDTNVSRIFCRVLGVKEKVSEKEIFALADAYLPAGQADPWNQSLMDFGALLCTGRNPKCESCPLAKMCSANTTAKQLGFAGYAAQLKAMPPPRKKTLRFADTDRFFRGRIMDILRNGIVVRVELARQMSEQYGLPADRFDKLLTKLVMEKMVELKNTHVGLAGSF